MSRSTDTPATITELNSSFQERFGDKLEVLPEFRGETTWKLDREIFHECMVALKEAGFDYLVDITTVDNMGEEPRFESVYELFSYTTYLNLRIKITSDEEEAEVPTVSDIWRTADWHEREAWDMMGIQFTGHPDLRRILMWEGYPYHPLRKEFPLEGKESEIPDIAFTRAAPLEGGPFVTQPGEDLSSAREPRSREPRTEIED